MKISNLAPAITIDVFRKWSRERKVAPIECPIKITYLGFPVYISDQMPNHYAPILMGRCTMNKKTLLELIDQFIEQERSI